MKNMTLLAFGLLLKNTKLWFLLMMIGGFSVTAQQVKWGGEYRNIKDNGLDHEHSSYFLGEDEKGSYMLHWNSENTYVVQTYDANMNIINTTEPVTLSAYQGKDRTAMHREESVFVLDNETYLMTKAIDEDNKLNYYLAEKFDKKSLKFVALTELLKADYDSGDKKSYYSFKYYTSPNNKKLLLLFIPINQDRYIVNYKLKVFNEDLTKDWEQTTAKLTTVAN